MLTLPNYKINAQIYESPNSLVYRGIRTQDDRGVILKVLKHDYPTPVELTRYRKEYELTRSLKADGVVKVYDLLKYQNTLAIVLEDFGGESLQDLLARRSFTLKEFLEIAIRITDSLGEIHAANIIHKDVNPSNIVINPATEQLKIIDFGISTVLTRSHPALKNPHVLEGTLAYMSPEQTGRMNRALDYRTDFYSLGVTFYQLLTNRLPFTSTDVMELVHCHIAKQSVTPCEINPAIPKIVSAIVMKLLAKMAEDRYQSAWGIKADLDKCWQQLDRSSTLSDFPLGCQDIADKFQIPQKLYGREPEIETLLAAFARVSDRSRPTTNNRTTQKVEMMLVAGYSGIGKSALVQELYKPITQKRGYFISGKFDQFQRTIPFSALVSAFSQLVRQLLSESETQLHAWRRQLDAALTGNGKAIVDVIPELELIIGKQEPVEQLGPTEARNRFHLVFQKFIQVFCQPEHPLIIFLDDLQWVDAATLKLIELLMTDETMQYLFLIGAYRDNEVTPAHPLAIALEGLREREAIVNKITLAPLRLNDITRLVTETLSCDRDRGLPLAKLLLKKTDGNPFFVNEFLKTLYRENLLVFEIKTRKWQWNVEQIEAVGITDNVVELMIGKLQKLPSETQRVLQLAACVGNHFDLPTISIVHERGETTTFQNLLPAIKEGLIQPTSELEIFNSSDINTPLLIRDYKFLHDRVQQAARTTIDERHKKAVHLMIGRLLLDNLSSKERTERIFELADHLNQGRELITNRRERINVAKLNLEAGKKAKESTAYQAAKNYLKLGIKYLSKTSWKVEYELTLELHELRAEIEYLQGNFDKSKQLIDFILERVKTDLEKAEVYDLLLLQYTLTANYEAAIQTGRKALNYLGIDLPESELQTALYRELAAAEQNLGAREIASLITAPEMTIPEKKLGVKLLSNIDPPAYFSNQELYAVIVVKMARMSLKYGHVPESAKAYVTYGIILGSVLGNYRAGYEFGTLAVKLGDKFHNRAQKCSACLILGGHLNHWVKHIKWAEEILGESYKAGLDSGELRHSGYAIEHQLRYLFYQGKNLEQLREMLPNFLHFNQKIKNQWAIDGLVGLQLALFNLTGMTAGKLEFHNGEIGDVQYLESCQEYNSLAWLCTFQIFKSQILYLYGYFAEALECSLAAEKWLAFVLGQFQVSEHNFHTSLILAALYTEASEAARKNYWQQLVTHQKQMKIWAENSPENFQHKYLLIAAEMARISGKDLEAMELYDRAIAEAGEREFIQNHALANELAAKFWLGRNKEDFAQLYLQRAFYSYQLWGAVRKLEDLSENYPHLLAKPVSKFPLENPLITTANNYTSTQSIGSLDLATVLKAAQTISSEIVLDKLLSNFMNILIENAGARQCSLILPEDGKLLIAARIKIDPERVIVQPYIPVAEASDLPVTVINYVERSRGDVILSNAVSEGQFANDLYISRHQLKSLLCTPILKGGQLIAILYLENNLITGAFTPDRLEVLRLLSAQASISIENALLYASVEQKVIERTQELNEKNLRLSQTLDQLKQTQSQLIHSEKMSGLGQIVAGVAHELNNPVSFIYGNISYAERYFKNLLDLVELYERRYPEPEAEISQTIEEIDLEFIAEDLPKILTAMKLGSKRIRNIVRSLQNFSGLDEADIKSVDIHQGIKSTLVMLQHRLRANADREQIVAIERYANLPQITCYPSQLNQVFLHVLNNAIDALSEKYGKRGTPQTGDEAVPRYRDNATHRYRERQPSPPTITITTEATSANRVKIRIADNGPGIGEEVRRKIFDPFYTTKPIGAGAGLGLSTSYSIVVDKHGGTLNCVCAPEGGAEFVIELPIQPRPSVS